MRKLKLAAFLLPAVLLGASPLLTSCSDDNNGEKDPVVKPDPNAPQADMTNEAQKERLDQIGQDFMNEIKAADVQALRDVADYVATQSENDYYDFTAVEDWAEACFNSLEKMFLSRTGSYSEIEGDGWKYIENIVETDYRQLWVASAFKGSFEENNGVWRQTSSNNLQFSFKDGNGQTCVLKLTTSGRETLAYIGETSDEEWNYLGYDEELGGSVTDIYIENTKIYARIPEQINVSLTRGSTTLASVKVNTSLDVNASGDYDLKRDKYSLSADVVAGAYTWNVTRAEYNTTNARVEAVMKHGNRTILTMNAKSDVGLTNDSVNSVNNTAVEIDLLGQLQIKGTCSDAKKYVEYLDNADENYEDGTAFNRWVTNANAIMDLGIYYDNNVKKQAWMRLEVEEETDYWGSGSYTYYEYVPVIAFIDGTSYAFGDYFTGDAFKNLVDSFNRLVEDFE